ERLGHLPIVRCEDHAARMKIEPPDREDPLRNLLEDILNRGAPLRISHRRDHPARLVHKIVDRLLRDDAPTVELDAIAARIDLNAELAHDDAIDAHPPRENQLFRLTPRGVPRLSDGLL